MPDQYTGFVAEIPSAVSYGSLAAASHYPGKNRPQEQVMQDEREENVRADPVDSSSCLCVTAVPSSKNSQDTGCCTTDCLCLPCNAIGSCLTSLGNCCQTQVGPACGTLLESCFCLCEVIAGVS